MRKCGGGGGKAGAIFGFRQRAKVAASHAPEIKSKETIRTCLIQTGAKVSFDCDWATSRIPPVIDARAKGRGSTSPAELRMVVFDARPGPFAWRRVTDIAAPMRRLCAAYVPPTCRLRAAYVPPIICYVPLRSEAQGFSVPNS